MAALPRTKAAIRGGSSNSTKGTCRKSASQHFISQTWLIIVVKISVNITPTANKRIFAQSTIFLFYNQFGREAHPLHFRLAGAKITHTSELSVQADIWQPQQASIKPPPQIIRIFAADNFQPIFLSKTLHFVLAGANSVRKKQRRRGTQRIFCAIVPLAGVAAVRTRVTKEDRLQNWQSRRNDSTDGRGMR